MGAGNQGAAMDVILWAIVIVAATMCLSGCGIIISAAFR
jgi:hypothetical protein